ncbi:unnamed protein product [Parajaminaea phylloscopi]
MPCYRACWLAVALTLCVTTSLAAVSPTLRGPAAPFYKAGRFYERSGQLKPKTGANVDQVYDVFASAPTEQEQFKSQTSTSLKSTLSFKSEASRAFNVGNHIPGIPFAVKNSWAGLIPLDPKADLSIGALARLKYQPKTRALYMWLWGADTAAGRDDLVVWLNGGPGCSSLEGFFTENGPIRYDNKFDKPRLANDSWTSSANVIWVEQPIGTGFTRGVPSARNEDDVAADFHAFLTNLYKIFTELGGKRLWITGESYAGRYVPYIVHKLQSEKNTFNVQGSMTIDGVVTDETLANEVVVYDYVKKYNSILKLNSTQLEVIRKGSDLCGYTELVDKYLKFPPPGRLPSYNTSGCGGFDEYTNAAGDSNPHFSVYKIDYSDPKYTFFDRSPLGDPYKAEEKGVYLNNRKVQDYIHAPHIDWHLCVPWVDPGVFPKDGGDLSPPPAQTVLPSVIEKSKRTIIANGELDGLIISNGILLGLQNMTWGGAQGFSKPPTQPLIGVTGEREGSYVTQRGLTFAKVDRAGHMIPGDRGTAGLALLRFLLGCGDLSKAKA